MEGHETSLNKLKMIEIVSSIFSDCNRLAITYKEKAGKNTNTWSQTSAIKINGSLKKSKRKLKNTYDK